MSVNQVKSHNSTHSSSLPRRSSLPVPVSIFLISVVRSINKLQCQPNLLHFLLIASRQATLPNSGDRLIAISICIMILAISFVALRSYAQRMTTSSYGWNDYLIAPALVANIGVCAHGISKNGYLVFYQDTEFISVVVKIADVGRHLPAVLIESPSKLATWAKCIYALELIYLAAVALPKLSKLCLYLRIFVQKVV